MNLSYVRSYLKAKRDTISAEDIDDLIEQIDTYQGTENRFEDIASIMRTVNEYNVSYLAEVQEYEVLRLSELKSPSRITSMAEKARGILCTLSLLHTYLVLSRAKVSESTYNMKNIRTYIADLDAKKEHYKSEKMAWVTILKSLTQEINYITEMRKMDLEEKLGYTK